MSAPAPLSSTHFDSIRDFQSYFQAHEELTIAANQQLVIRQTPSFIREGLPESDMQKLTHVIDRILLPLARSAAILSPKKVHTVPLQITEHSLTARLAIPWTIELNPRTTQLMTRIDHLFRMLDFSKVYSLIVSPAQGLLLTDLTAQEMKPPEVKNSRLSLFERHVPAGFMHTFKGTNQFDYGLGSNFIRLTSPDSMEISLKKHRVFETPVALLQEIEAKGSVVIQGSEVAKIQYPFLQEALKDYETFFAGTSISKLRFLFDHMMLIGGKGVTSQSSGSLAFEVEGSELTLYSLEGGATTFVWSEMEKFTDCKNIQETLFLFARSSFKKETGIMTVFPKQPLIFYGFKSEELAKLVEPEISAVERIGRLNKLFFKHASHVGNGLQLFSYQSMQIKTMSIERESKPSCHLLILEADKSFELGLARTTSPKLIALQVINLAHPQLLADLLEGEFNAMAQLFFLILFHCCCEAKEWGEDQEREFLAGLFKAETIQKIRALKQKEAFKTAYREIQADPALKAALDQILHRTPDEFGELDLSQLKPSLRQIVGDLKDLEHGEFQGGFFVGSVIQALVSELNDPHSPTVQHLLLHPHPQAAAAAPAKEEHKGAGK